VRLPRENPEYKARSILAGDGRNDEFDAPLFDNGGEDTRQTVFSQIAVEF